MSLLRRQLIAVAFVTALLLPATAGADMLGVYARGHASFLQGPAEQLSYFENNDAGLGYGFQIGAEVVQVDVFLDANFHPQGSQWNQIGIGWDMDFVPGPVFLEPSVQLLYFFGKQHDGSEGVKGLFPRVGGQVGVKFLKVMYVGAEAYLGYALSLPDPEGGLTFMGAGYLGFSFSAL